MPQVSAHAYVPVPSEVAAQIVAATGGVGVRPLPHVRLLPSHWRYDLEGSGTRVVLVIPYAVHPAWLRRLSHEVTSWVMRRRVERRVDEIVAAARAQARPDHPGLPVERGSRRFPCAQDVVAQQDFSDIS